MEAKILHFPEAQVLLMLLMYDSLMRKLQEGKACWGAKRSRGGLCPRIWLRLGGEEACSQNKPSSSHFLSTSQFPLWLS